MDLAIGNGGESMSIVKDNAAQEAEDAARHGYNGRDGDGAKLLKLCAKAVRIAAANVQRGYGIPAVSADERAEYASDLVARMLGENGGRIPAPGSLSDAYLVQRAAGIILNDRERRTIGMGGGNLAEDARAVGAAEAGADHRLTGPLALTDEVERLAAELELSETGKRALAACMIPATRQEWADFFGYSSGKAFHVVAWRGRAELVAVGEGAIRDALAKIEAEAGA
jgi:hypothetical protein